MKRCEETKRMNRTLRDLLIGLGVFALVFLAASADGSQGPQSMLAQVANAGEIARAEVVDTLGMIDEEFALSEPVYRGTERGTAMLLLTLVFSSMVAFNLWFFRHLRRVHASLPRVARG